MINALGWDHVVDASGLQASAIGVTLTGGTGDDVLIGGPGENILNGAPGNDILI